ncbi:MAG TPA: DNA recombination protein RmuC, partial [Acidimicrobiales bacterium]
MEIVLVAVLALGVGAAVAWIVASRSGTDTADDTQTTTQQAVAEAVQQAVQQLQAQAASEREAAVRAAVDQLDRLSTVRVGAAMQAGQADLTAKKDVIDQRLAEVQRSLQTELDRVSGLVAQLSTASAQQFGEVSARLRAHAETTESLAATAQGLREALANPKARGQWGERMAEDVLRLAGFVENVNYVKQTALEDGRIPDFSFPLPKGQVLYMDVKFPLASYLKYLEAGTDAERSAHRDQFLRDVRLRVKELAARDYADRARSSLDYVLLFLPNESIIGFIHEQSPAIVDDALAQKVVLCSPLTLFAMLGVIRQAFDNFMIECTANEMLSVIGAFRQQYDKFGEALDKVGRQLDGTRK